MAEKLAELDLSPRVERISLLNKTSKTDSRLLCKNPGKLLERRAQKQQEEEEEGEGLRQLLCSPAPMKYAVEAEPSEDVSSHSVTGKTKPMFPHITVQKCEEKAPPWTKRQQSPPPYLESNSRSGSSNSLEIPSPVLDRRSIGGKDIIVLTPGNLLNTYSKSEGCLHSKSVDRNKKCNLLEASLLQQTRSQTLTPSTTPLIVTGKSSSRPSSRVASPSPRDVSKQLYKY